MARGIATGDDDATNNVIAVAQSEISKRKRPR
jgi:hypothetical protein